jgi:hypothetical protein
MVASGMLRRVTLVRTDVSEESSASFIRVTRIGELGTTLVAVSVVLSSILVTLMKEALDSSDTSVLTRATRRNIPEDTIVHGHRRENSCFTETSLLSRLTRRHVQENDIFCTISYFIYQREILQQILAET